MMDLLQKLLSSAGLDGYKINRTVTETDQLFFVHDRVETVRRGRTTDYSVSVYLAHDGALGDASFRLSPTATEQEIASAVAAAKENARAIRNQPYSLVRGETGSFSHKNLIEGKSLAEVAEAIANAVFAERGSAGAGLNATEIFLYHTDTRIVNSDGTDKSSSSYSAMIETIPTFDLPDRSVETYAQTRLSSFDEPSLRAYIREELRKVELRAKAEKIDLPAGVAVTLPAEEICEILSEYADQLHYSALYTHSGILKKGDEIQTAEDCDRITLTAVGKAEGACESADFDEDGSSLTDRTLIRDGKVEAFFGGNRFAQYVGEPNTGNLRVLSLAPGSLTEEELFACDRLECLQFSGLQVDLFNDYIGGEVRLAVLHKDGKEIPATAFSISGKLSEVLNTLRLSEKTTARPNYVGPAVALLEKFTIL